MDPDRWLHQQTSAVWEDIPGPMAVLRENHPDQDYGKVESAIIAVDVDTYPILRVRVAAVDPDASCTIQILDKRTESWRDVLPKITYPDEYTVDLTRAIGWHGPQVFTINVWIGGEAKTITLDRISIEPRAAVPAD